MWLHVIARVALIAGGIVMAFFIGKENKESGTHDRSTREFTEPVKEEDR